MSTAPNWDRYPSTAPPSGRVCPVCGRLIPGRASKRGQPRRVCGPDCARVQEALRVLADRLPHLDATVSARRAVRGEVWRAANQLRCGQTHAERVARRVTAAATAAALVGEK